LAAGLHPDPLGELTGGKERQGRKGKGRERGKKRKWRERKEREGGRKEKELEGKLPPSFFGRWWASLRLAPIIYEFES